MHYIIINEKLSSARNERRLEQQVIKSLILGDIMKLPIDYHNTHWATRRKAREEYAKIQNNKCYHCGNPLDDKPTFEILQKYINKRLFPQDFFKWPIHLHHNHHTGITIGAVHSHCNAVLWQYHGE